MKRLIYITLVFTFVANTLAAQKSPQFPEGLYFTHAAFVAREPDLQWADIKGEMVQLPEAFRVQIADFRLADGREAPEIYAVSLDGFPYLFVKHNERLNYHEFTGMRLNGRYRYVEYTKLERTDNVMYAYNPVNGRPFRQGRVKREKEVLQRRILDLASGKEVDFNREEVANIVETDGDLLRAVQLIAVDDPEADNKLLQAIRIYNQRYPTRFTITE